MNNILKQNISSVSSSKRIILPLYMIALCATVMLLIVHGFSLFLETETYFILGKYCTLTTFPLVCFIRMMRTTRAPDEWWQRVMWSIVCVPCLFISALFVNRWMDDSIPKEKSFAIMSKQMSQGSYGGALRSKMGGEYVSIRNPFPSKVARNVAIRVNDKTYNSITPYNTGVTLKVHNGYLGFPWYNDLKFAAGVSDSVEARVPLDEVVIKSACDWSKTYNASHDIGNVLPDRHNIKKENNVIVTDEPLVNGQIHGIAKYIYPDGIRVEISYVHGKMQGYNNFYDKTGRLTQRILYKDNEPYGLADYYNKNDGLSEQILWANDGTHPIVSQRIPASSCK